MYVSGYIQILEIKIIFIFFVYMSLYFLVDTVNSEYFYN